MADTTTTPTPPQQPTPSAPQTGKVFETQTGNTTETSFYGQLVGEGKKFRDNEALAKSKLESDQFIERLQRENAEIREELKKRPSTEEVIELVQSRLTPDPDRVDEQKGGGSQPGPLTASEISKLVTEQLVHHEHAKTAQANIDSVGNRLAKHFGDDNKAKEFLVTKSRELNLSLQQMQDVAAKSPSAFFNLVGIVDTPPSPAGSVKNRGSVQVDSLVSGNDTNKYSYYRKLRKENPAKYFTPSIQNEIFRKTKELGEAFLDS